MFIDNCKIFITAVNTQEQFLLRWRYQVVKIFHDMYSLSVLTSPSVWQMNRQITASAASIAQ